jgi:hypothetical protein
VTTQFASSNSSSRFVHLFVDRTRSVTSTVNYVSLCELQESITVEEIMYLFNSRIMSYILNMLIYVGIILLDNLLQCFMFITMIDLSRTFDSTLFQFVIYYLFLD